MIDFEQEIIGHVANATINEYFAGSVDLVHKIEHTLGVVNDTITICHGEGIPLLKPVIAAWLHDFGRPAEHQARQKGIMLPHAEVSARQVPIILRPFRESLGDQAIQEIQTAVAIHSRLNPPEDNVTAKILMDADKLAALGFSGLCRTITASYHNRFIDLSDPFPDRRIKPSDVTKPEVTLVQRMLATIELFAVLRMPTAIRIGLSRVQIQIGFLEEIAKGLGLPKDLLEQNVIIQEARETMQRVMQPVPSP